MKSILVIIPYRVFPPVNGGMQRCFHILLQLAAHFDVTLIIRQKEEELSPALTVYPVLNRVTIRSTFQQQNKRDVFSVLPHRYQNALRFRWYKKAFNGSADIFFLDYYHLLRSILKKRVFDFVILENLATINAVSIIRQFSASTKIIYDAHNVDSYLAFQTGNKYFKVIRKSESCLWKKTDAVIACSKNDLKDLQLLNKGRLKGSVIPNGVLFSNNCCGAINSDRPEYILFCGSLDYHPNAEGLLWFYINCWEAIKEVLPNIKLLVVGSGQRLQCLDVMDIDKTVIFTGWVDDVFFYYDKACLGIVPLLTGSGTRLKVLEAMALGLPLVSTAKGAEGIEYTDHVNIVIADKEDDFKNAVIELLNDKAKRIRLQKSARELIKKQYDWNIIGNSLADYLTSL